VVDPKQQEKLDQVFFGASVTYANDRGNVKTITIVGISRPGHCFHHFRALYSRQLVEVILHMAMALRGHVVLVPGRDGQRLVWQVAVRIQLLNERLAQQILRSSGDAAIGPYLGPSNTRSSGDGDDAF
jgi:hypothetical protein